VAARFVRQHKTAAFLKWREAEEAKIRAYIERLQSEAPLKSESRHQSAVRLCALSHASDRTLI